MSKAKSFDYMVAFLMSVGETRRDRITPQGDVTEFTEKCLLKGYNITGKTQYLAKNLLASEFN